MPSFSKSTFFTLAAVAATSVTATPVVVRPGSAFSRPVDAPFGTSIKRDVNSPTETFQEMRKHNPGFVGPRQVSNPADDFRKMRQQNPGFVGPRQVSNPADDFRKMRQQNPGFVGPRMMPLQVNGGAGPQPPNSDKTTPPPSENDQPAQDQPGKSFEEMRKQQPGFVGPREVDGPMQPADDNQAPPVQAQTAEHPPNSDAHIYHREEQRPESFQQFRQHNPNFVGPRDFKTSPAEGGHGPMVPTPGAISSPSFKPGFVGPRDFKTHGPDPLHPDAMTGPTIRDVNSPAENFQEMRKHNPNFVGPRSEHAPHRGFRGPRYIIDGPNGEAIHPQCKGAVCPLRRELSDLVARVMVESPDGHLSQPACKGEICAMRRELARAIAEFDARSVADELD